MTEKKEGKERKGEEQGRQGELKGKCVCWTALSLASGGRADTLEERKGCPKAHQLSPSHTVSFLGAGASE